jgi:hypothetical protein
MKGQRRSTSLRDDYQKGKGKSNDKGQYSGPSLRSRMTRVWAVQRRADGILGAGEVAKAERLEEFAVGEVADQVEVGGEEVVVG